jgi:hypothetical protein
MMDVSGCTSSCRWNGCCFDCCNNDEEVDTTEGIVVDDVGDVDDGDVDKTFVMNDQCCEYNNCTNEFFNIKIIIIVHCAIECCIVVVDDGVVALAVVVVEEEVDRVIVRQQ